MQGLHYLWILGGDRTATEYLRIASIQKSMETGEDVGASVVVMTFKYIIDYYQKPGCGCWGSSTRRVG